jgi:hypothetical protein
MEFTTPLKRQRFNLGDLMSKSRALTAELSAGPPRRERAGLESIMASSYAPPPRPPKHLHGAHCGNCLTLDSRMIEVDLRFGVRICTNCGAVDSTPIRSADTEDMRTFEGDAICHDRTEFRDDGQLGSYIFAKAGRRSGEPASIRSLQRAQQRLSTFSTGRPTPAAEAVGAETSASVSLGAGVVERDKTRLSNAIISLAAQMDCCVAMRDDAVRLGNSWLGKRSAHARACADPATCAFAHMAIPHPIEGFAAVFIQRASSTSAEGVGATLAIQHFAERFANSKSTRVMHASLAMLDLLAYDPGIGCGVTNPVADALIDAQCAVQMQASDVSKGIAGRAVDAMKLGYALKSRVFDTLDWMCDASLLVGKQPATVVSTAIYMTLLDLNPAPMPPPAIASICKAVGLVKAETVRKAIQAVTQSPQYLKRCGSPLASA